MKITNSDIATVEALHDFILDRGLLKINDHLLKSSRALTAKMYAEIYEAGEVKIYTSRAQYSGILKVGETALIVYSGAITPYAPDAVELLGRSRSFPRCFLCKDIRVSDRAIHSECVLMKDLTDPIRDELAKMGYKIKE